jgi:4-diphosphocytidyl-2-C-methyl-D-erythritol kinase
MQISELAQAKINLCLHVTGLRSDGYHLLDSIVVFANIGDVITVKPSDAFTLEIDGFFADDLGSNDDNLVMQAARLFSDNCKGAAITLTKNLPVASGIGGGSADAAATIRAMARMTGAAVPDDTGLSLGADVPVCLQSKSCQMQGIGEQIKLLSEFPNYAAVLVCPKVTVATSVIFKALEDKTNSPIDTIENGQEMDVFLSKQRNDLEEPAIQFAPEIAECLNSLRQVGGFLVRMSGSGATCFGLFETHEQAKKAAVNIASDNPDWWVQVCILGA